MYSIKRVTDGKNLRLVKSRELWVTGSPRIYSSMRHLKVSLNAYLELYYWRGLTDDEWRDAVNDAVKEGLMRWQHRGSWWRKFKGDRDVTDLMPEDWRIVQWTESGSIILDR